MGRMPVCSEVAVQPAPLVEQLDFEEMNTKNVYPISCTTIFPTN